MTGAERFIWQQDSLAFAGNQPVARTLSPTGFRAIPAAPHLDALTALGAAVQAGQAFCISDTPLPVGTEAQPKAFLTLTGGTSGQPKVIRRSQASWIASFAVNARLFGLSPADTFAVLGSLSHSLSLYGTLEAMHLGADIHLLAGIRPRQQREHLLSQCVTVIYVTPTQLRLLAQGAGRERLPELRLILCGGGHFDAATRAAALTLCPNAACHVFYGAAETSFVTLADPETPEGAVGRAYPGVTLSIFDKEGRPTQDIGEVWVQSPYLFSGYAQGDGPDTRWRGDALSIGEIGRLDADGALWLAGRKSRMTQIADQTVFPEAIEATIAAQPGIDTCAVLPVPDSLRGNRLIAVVGGTPDPDLSAAIIAACRAVHGPLAAPQKVLWHPDFPLLPSGKPDLPALVRWVETLT